MTGHRDQLPPSHTLLCDHSGLGATCFLFYLSSTQVRTLLDGLRIIAVQARASPGGKVSQEPEQQTVLRSWSQAGLCGLSRREGDKLL